MTHKKRKDLDLVAMIEQGVRPCSRCGEVKDLSQFHRSPNKVGYVSRCKTCISEVHREINNRPGAAERRAASLRAQREADPEGFRRKARDKHLRLTYGLTLAEWETLFEEQGFACAVCGATEPGRSRGWHTDHDHATGAVRGILCHGCNVTLGQVGDSVERLLLLVDYLRRQA